VTALPTGLTQQTLRVVPRTGRQSRRVEELLALVGDLIPAVVCVALGHSHIALGIVVAMFVYGLRGLYRRRFSLSVLDDLGSLVTGGLLGLLAVLLVAPPSTATGLKWMSLFVLGVILVRTLGYALMHRLRTNGAITYPVVLIGAGGNSAALAQRILDHPESGLRPVGFVDSVDDADSDLPHLGNPDALPQVIREHRVTDVIVAFGKLPTASLVTVLRTCNRMGVEISMVPRLFEMHRLSPGGDHVWGLPLVRMRQHAASAWTWRVKRAMDLVIGSILVVLFSPVLALIALAVRFELGRPLLFRQERVSYGSSWGAPCCSGRSGSASTASPSRC
jgi:hypothetical protein